MSDAQALLVKRNREIAEVRDESVRTEAELETLQIQNKDLLETSSNLDSEVSRQAARALVAEAQTAELEAVLRGREEELSTQQDAHKAAASVLHRQVAAWESEIRQAENEGYSEEQRAESLIVELGRLRQELDVENGSIDELRQSRQEFSRVSSEFAGVVPGLEAELLALDRRAASARSESSASKSRIETIQAELSAEQVRRDELGRSLRKAHAEQASVPTRLQTLEGQLAARGGDPAAIIAALRAVSDGDVAVPPSTGDEAEAAAKAEKLRTELNAVEETCQELRTSLDRKRGQKLQAADKLQGELDRTRGDLQKTLQLAVSASNSEIQHLENEVAMSETHSMNEALAERTCSQKVTRLREERSEMITQQDLALTKSQNDAGRCGQVTEECRQARAKAEDAEQQIAVFRARVTEDEAEKRKVQAEGDARAVKVRGMIEDLWRGIRAQASRADITVPSVVLQSQ